MSKLRIPLPPQNVGRRLVLEAGEHLLYLTIVANEIIACCRQAFARANPFDTQPLRPWGYTSYLLCLTGMGNGNISGLLTSVSPISLPFSPLKCEGNKYTLSDMVQFVSGCRAVQPVRIRVGWLSPPLSIQHTSQKSCFCIPLHPRYSTHPGRIRKASFVEKVCPIQTCQPQSTRMASIPIARLSYIPSRLPEQPEA